MKYFQKNLKAKNLNSLGLFIILGLFIFILSSCSKENPPAFKGFTSTDYRLMGGWKLVRMNGFHEESVDSEVTKLIYSYDRKSSHNLYVYAEYSTYYIPDFTFRYYFYEDNSSVLEFVSPTFKSNDDEWKWLDSVEKDVLYIQSMDFLFGFQIFEISELTNDKLILVLKGKQRFEVDDSEHTLTVELDYEFEKM